MKYPGYWSREMEKRRSVMPDGNEWRPGFDDYDTLKALRVSSTTVIFHPVLPTELQLARYPNRLTRWPSEVAKEKALLETLPLWDQDIEYPGPLSSNPTT
jgi:hypothetical protein